MTNKKRAAWSCDPVSGTNVRLSLSTCTVTSCLKGGGRGHAVLTHGLLADDAAGLLDAWRAGGGGAALPHGCSLARLVPAPAFGEGAIHDLALALAADTWSGQSVQDTISRCTINASFFSLVLPPLVNCTLTQHDKIYRPAVGGLDKLSNAVFLLHR